MFVLIARYVVRPGEEDAVEAALRAMTPLSRAEPGCLVYQAHRAVEDSSLFVLYEAYASEEAYVAHTQTEHFARYVLGDAVPRLVSREREFYTALE
jgi:quinol monooxygenase YgiN